MNTNQENVKCDIAIVGGSLSGGLTALALRKMRPDLSIILIDSAETFGGNHIWSYFASDIHPDNRWLTAPLVTCGWSGYDVHFPEHSRTLDNIYYSIESERLHEVLIETLPNDSIFLKMLQLEDPHNLRRPIIMDASVTQYDGYRFVYILPFSMDKIFVEDTYYSDNPHHDNDSMTDRLTEYINDAKWNVREVIREETGVLPVIMDGDLDKYWASGSGRVAKIGMRGGFFHSVTSYSLPDAVRTAIFIAQQNDFDGDRLNLVLRNRANQHWVENSFYRKLNKMLFRAAVPHERYKILEKFYTLSPELISRFYSGNSSAIDKLRIISGKAPVPIKKAMKAIMSKPSVKRY